MKYGKLILVSVIAFVFAGLLGELSSIAVGFILPESLRIIAWIFDGAVTAYGFFLLASIGAVFAYKAADSEEFATSQKDIKSLMIVFILFVSSVMVCNALISSNTKQIVVATSMIGLTASLFSFNFIRSKRKSHLYSDNNEHVEHNKADKKSNNQEDFWPILESLYNKQESEITRQNPSDWRGKQQKALSSIWLKGIRSAYSVSCNTVDNYADFIILLTEEEVIPPAVLDYEILAHYEFAKALSFDFGQFMADNNDSIYPNCSIKPESLLPYPKFVIYTCLNYFADCLENKLFNSDTFTHPDDIVTACRILSKGLEGDLEWLPLDESQIPSNPEENIKMFAEHIMQRHRDKESQTS